MTLNSEVSAPPRRSVFFDESVARNMHESVELISNLLESSTEHSIIGRDLQGTIVLWNEGARRTYGYEAEEVVGKANCDILHVPEEVAAGLSENISQAAIRDGRWEGTIPRLRRNGERFSVRIVVIPRRDAHGSVVGTMLVSRDISEELRLAKEALFHAQSLTDASLDPFVTISPRGMITDLNRAFEQMTGLPREHLIATDFSNYFTETEKAREVCARAFSEGYVREYALAILHANGTMTDVACNASVYKDMEGRVQGVFAVARDVTERKRFEQSLLKANRMKSEFLAGMSHELRTPLNGIIGFTEFMIDEKPGPLTLRQKEYLNDVLDSACHLLQLINDVLDLSKIEAGRLTLHPQVFAVGKAVAEVASIMNGNAGKKRISVAVEVEQGLDAVVLDEHKFKQVLYNLLSNAIKFTDAGGRVEIRARRADGPEAGELSPVPASLAAPRLELTVRDTGIGIRAEDMSRLFLEFEQLDSGLARRFEGTGLGLALTKRIVEFQGGSIGVVSEPHKGSAFTVILPLLGEEKASK